MKSRFSKSFPSKEITGNKQLPGLYLVTQSCPTLCDPKDCSPPGFSAHGILQTRIQEWVAIAFSRGYPDPGIEPRSLALQADSLPSKPQGKPNYQAPTRKKFNKEKKKLKSHTLEKNDLYKSKLNLKVQKH